MQLLMIYLFTILASFSMAHVCTDDWGLVHLRDGPACWALLAVPDFSSEYDTAVKVCDAANAKGAQVQNSPEKAILADIASRVLEPTLTCYKVSQAAVEGQFKSVDYESPPEYLRKINEEGKVKLEKGIEVEDTITIGFSVKMSRPGSGPKEAMLDSQIRIGNSSNSSQYSINVKCSRKLATQQCKIEHPPWNNTQPKYVSMMVADMDKKLTVDNFGVFEFNFIDRQIHVLGMKLLVPDEFSYIGMDEISVENMIVTRLEHSKKCQNTDYYAFGTKKSTKELPDTHTEAAHVPVRRRSLGSNYTFLVQSNQFDFYRYKEDEKTGNPWIFDVRMAGKGWSYIQVEFWNQGPDNSTEICKFRFDDQGLMFTEPTGKSENLDKKTGKEARGNSIVNMRFTITSNYEKMEMSVDLMSRGVNLRDKKVAVKHLAIDEIRLLSDNIDFFDAQMTLLEDVNITTCNYRKMEPIHMGESVPFRQKCFKKRNILCQREAEDLPEEDVVDEESEKIVWGEEREQAVTSHTIEAQEPEREGVVRGNFVEEVSVDSIGGFQWCIIGLTTLAAASFIVIFVLNIIRCAF